MKKIFFLLLIVANVVCANSFNLNPKFGYARPTYGKGKSVFWGAQFRFNEVNNPGEQNWSQINTGSLKSVVGRLKRNKAGRITNILSLAYNQEQIIVQRSIWWARMIFGAGLYHYTSKPGVVSNQLKAVINSNAGSNAKTSGSSFTQLQECMEIYDYEKVRVGWDGKYRGAFKGERDILTTFVRLRERNSRFGLYGNIWSGRRFTYFPFSDSNRDQSQYGHKGFRTKFHKAVRVYNEAQSKNPSLPSIADIFAKGRDLVRNLEA